MTIVTVKEKLHDYIEHADDKKVKALYILLENEIALNASIERGLRDSEKGFERPHEEVMREIRKQYNL